MHFGSTVFAKSRASEQRLSIHSHRKNSIMLTSRSIIFALLIFLTGANACVKCPPTVWWDGGSMSLLKTIPGPVAHTTSCLYADVQNSGSPVEQCVYETATGKLTKKLGHCPATVPVKANC
ncbi:uncharacterized protein EDB91DRAFT_1178145 [Suillus paluster]|uniref:uncharacterized protein n=1 Tax=Suillus paluster TaxID=48578 RepID=UPI001B87B2DC|nr:uncharacterized protein EDB91DRAFT_1178145 [Suillus paluster]KAG1720352.1 hypothetical protein EDB91DRAFT_1178145 [Suillus paluster]